MGVFQNNLMGAAAAAASAGGGDFYTHQIANSIRADTNNGYLKRTPSSAGNRATWTFSTWVKRSQLPTSTCIIYAAGSSGNQDGYYRLYWTSNKFVISSAEANFATPADLFRDTSAWYHVVWKQGSNTTTLYVNNRQVTTASVSGNTAVNNNVQQVIGNNSSTLGDSPVKGYMAETIMIDGTALDPDSFGETKNGVWIPKDASGLTFGTNGFHLKYESSSDLGNDSSGNNNDWTAVNLSTHDQMLDTPTFNSDSNGGNFATLNPLNTRGSTAVATQLTEGNLKWTPGATQDETSGTMSIGASGVDKVYIEVYCENNSDTGWFGVYDQKDGTLMNAVVQSVASAVRFKPRTGDKVTAGTSSTYIGDGSENNPSGIIFQMAVDVPAGKIWWGKANAWGSDGGGSPTDSNVAFTTLNTDGTYLLFTHTGGASVAQPDWVFNFGQDGTFAGNKTAQGNSDDTGYGNFYYSPPSGFKALCAGNVSVAAEVDPAQTDDDYPQKVFNSVLYTGNGGTNNITGLGFQPDWTWIKERGGANDHKITDSTRGVTKAWESNTSNAFTTDTNGLTAFGTDGFTVGSDAVYNNSSDTYVAWNWRLNGGTTAANAVGGTSSVTQVDPSGGISVVTYTGFAGASGSSTVGHGMSVAPEMVITLSTNGSGWWTQVPSVLTNAGYFLNLNSTGAETDLNSYGTMNAPTTSVFTINGVEGVGGSSRNYVAYCFGNIEGFCKVGGYVGNGSTDNAFIYTGFRPAFVLTKGVRSGDGWNIHDDATSPSNVADTVLQPNTSSAELSNYNIDMLSNGFKVRDGDGDLGSSGATYIYLAFAKNPFQFATAR